MRKFQRRFIPVLTKLMTLRHPTTSPTTSLKLDIFSGNLSVGQLPFQRTRNKLEALLWGGTQWWMDLVGRRSSHRSHINEIFREARQIGGYVTY